MALKHLGHGFTDSNGIATLDYDANGNQLANSGYVGTGAGLIQMMACYNEEDTERMIESEIYETLDCIIYDDMETENINKYKISNNANIGYSSDWYISASKSIKWTYDNTAPSNTKYWGFYFKDNPTAIYFDLSQLKGQQIKLELDVNCEIDFDLSKNAGMYIAVYYKEPSNPIWQTLGSVIIFNSNTQHYEGIYNIPSNCTDLWVRVNANANCPSGILYADNWKIYPI